MRIFTVFLIFLLLLQTPQASAQHFIPEDDSSAVILAYYRVGEDTNPNANIRMEQFRAHVTEMVKGGYNVMAVKDILKAVKAGEKLPQRTIGITFQGGHKSILENAAPLLLENNLPFTVFYVTDSANYKRERYMDWAELQDLERKKGVDIGIMPASFDKVSALPMEENTRQLNKAMSLHRENLGQTPKLFSYGYGEYTKEYKSLIAKQGFDGAFGLHSGVVYQNSDFNALPRFTMTERFGDLERFQIVAETLVLPASDIEPDVSIIRSAPGTIGFTVSTPNPDFMDKINCYASGQGKLETQIVGSNRVEIRPEILSGDRLRINCTAPAGNSKNKNEYGRIPYRWLGYRIHVDENIPAPLPVKQDDAPQQPAPTMKQRETAPAMNITEEKPKPQDAPKKPAPAPKAEKQPAPAPTPEIKQPEPEKPAPKAAEPDKQEESKISPSSADIEDAVETKKAETPAVKPEAKAAEQPVPSAKTEVTPTPDDLMPSEDMLEIPE